MHFLVIDGQRAFRDATCFMIQAEGHRATAVESEEAGLESLAEDKFDAVLLDLNLGRDAGLDLLATILKLHPVIPVIVFTEQPKISNVVDAMRRGAADFLEKPFTSEQFHLVLARVQRFCSLSENIERLAQRVRDNTSQCPEPLLSFESPPMREVMDILIRAANSPASILLLGESGTGKSVVARAIHDHSHLADKPFVTVSCPSLTKELLESDLFGHVKGAFTGAIKDHWGKVKTATGGTLFLDEIGDLPLEIQPKLLRLLQEREYERLGENVVRKADIRVITATNRDLKKRMSEGLFREDLYFRLSVIEVEMSPLRSRREDLLRFANHYLSHFANHSGRRFHGFSDEATARLLTHPWRGNLRELRNAVERAVILARTDRIMPEDLPLEVRHHSNGTASAPQPGELLPLEKLEEIHLRRVLEQTSSVAEAAKILGIDEATIYRKRKKYDQAAHQTAVLQA